MLVKELIDVLSKMDPEATVFINDVLNSSFTSWGQNIEKCEVDEVCEMIEDGKKGVYIR